MSGRLVTDGSPPVAGDARPPERRLSHAQRQIWAGQQLHPDVPLYNMAFALTIDGPLDADLFAAAFADVVGTTDALRTVFRMGEDGPERVVLAASEIGVDVARVDLRGTADPAGEAARFTERAARQVLDLGTRLFDTALLTLDEQTHVWYLNQHHLIADAWSLALIHRRVADAYREREADGAARPAPSYQSLVDHECAEVGRRRAEAAAAFWDERLAEPTPPPPVYGAPRHNDATSTTRSTRTIEGDRMAALSDAISRPGLRSLTRDLSLFNVVASVLGVWMARTSGQDRVRLGFPAHNRVTPLFKETAGVFIELFPLDVDVDVDETFASLVGRTTETSMNVLRHCVSGAGRPEFSRTFNVVLNLITVSLGDFAGRTVRTEWVHCGHGDPGHYVRVQLHDFDATGAWTVLFDFNDAVFDADQREFAVDHFFQLLDGVLADPDTPVGAVRLPGERESGVLDGFVRGAPLPPLGPVAPRAFEQRVALHPDRLACEAAGKSLTYAELDAAANRLAHRLRAIGADTDTVVAICTGRTVEMVVAMLGVHKAGAAYLPLDPADPVDRRRALISASRAVALVVDASTVGALGEASLPVVRVDDTAGRTTESSAAPDVQIGGDDLAYVMPTSGSTGRPKLVLVEHRNLTALVAGLDARVYRHHDVGEEPLRVALVAPYVFDPSVQQLFGALLLGHTLCIVADDDRVDGARLFDFFVEHRIDVADGTPAHLQLLLDGSDRAMSDLRVRHLIIGGDALPKASVERFLRAFDGSAPRITNAYGPAECCVDCITWPVTGANLGDRESIPIGTPLDGERAYVVDRHGQLQPFGVVGELCLAGTGVGRGYLADPDLTAQRFVADPFVPGATMYRTGDLARRWPDGVIEFVGRDDLQVKIRGHRVELGEVETAIKQFRVTRRLIPLRQAEPTRCSRCVLTDRHPGVDIVEGVCSVCRRFDAVRDEIDGYFGTVADFGELVRRSPPRPGGDYDCMLLYSGGKDSSYVLHRLVEMGLRVLAFTFDNGHISPGAFANIRRQTTQLGVDSVVMDTAEMDEIFLLSLDDDSTVCSGCFRALTAISTRLALDHGIGTVVTGLSRGQIFDTKLAGLVDEGITDVAEIEARLRDFRAGYHSRRDRTAELLGLEIDLPELETIEFVDWFRYDDTPTTAVREFLRSRDEYWRQPADTGFCSSNCRMNDVGIAVHTVNAGYHNYEAPLSWDIRLGVVTRADALAEVGGVGDLDYVRTTLDEIGYLVREVRDAAVTVAVDEQTGAQELHAFYVAPQTLPVAELRSFLGRHLPDYMIPARFFRVDRIPLTANGKIDRSALRPDTSRPELGAAPARPTNDVERRLVGVWEQVLGIEPVGVHDNFFEIGGDSIKAIQIVGRAREAGVGFTALQLFSCATIAALAAEATEANAVDHPDAADRTVPELPDVSAEDLSRLAELLE